MAAGRKPQTEKHARTSPAVSQKRDHKLVELILPPTHPRQYEYITSFERENARFVVAACGTKFGKTVGSAIWLTKQAWNTPNSLNWWIAPSHSQTEIGKGLIRGMLPRGTYEEFKADSRIVIYRPNGDEHSRIEFKTAVDEALLRGFKVHNFVLDEAARVSREAYLSVLTTVTQTRGKGIIVSTPYGRGWFYEAYQKGEKFYEDGTSKYNAENPDPDPEWFSIRLPTHTNPWVPEESIIEARKNLSEDEFRREYLALFIDDSAGVFRGVNACVRGRDFELPRPGRNYVIGLDIARLNDYTVMVVMDVENRHVVYVERIKQVSWEAIHSRIVLVAQKYNAPVCADSTGVGDPIVEQLQRAGIAVYPYKLTGSAAKKDLIEKLKIGIERQELSYPQNSVSNIMMDELKAYEYTITERGTMTYSAPRGKHDDCVISLALAYWLVDKPVFKYVYKQVSGI